ncbi:MAG: hypothetical protein GDYSWBUE_001478 [Candidatus Fervidibacterota bacterium]
MRLRSTHVLLLALVAIVLIGIIVNAIVTSQRAILNRPPDIEILVTGKMRGRFELCGCPGERAMSLPVRAQAIRELTLTPELRERLILIESGDFTSDRESVKVAMLAFKMLGYDLVSIAQGEQPHIDEVLSQAKRLNIKLLARGVKGGEVTGGLCKSLWTLDCSKYKVAFITTGIQPTSSSDKAVKSKWDEVMQDIKSASKSADVVILVNYWNMELLKSVMKATDAGRLITAVINHASSQQLRRPEMQRQLETSFLTLPNSLLPMPLLRIWIRKGKVRYISMATYTVAEKIPDEKIKAIVEAYYRERQKRLMAQWSVIVRRARKYTPPNACAECHEGEYRQWLTTKHASAIQTLKERHRLEPDCLKCHSEEFRQTKRLTATEKGRGVECVSCHVELKDPTKVKEHGQMPSDRARPPRVDPQKVCVQCHNKEHSPQFETMQSDYMSKVRH